MVVCKGECQNLVWLYIQSLFLLFVFIIIIMGMIAGRTGQNLVWAKAKTNSTALCIYHDSTPTPPAPHKRFQKHGTMYSKV